MTTDDHIVFIVDDDARIREALSELLESHGIRAVAYGSAGEYVRADKPDLPACLILDVELPDINGLDLQKQIADGDHPPIVFITGHGDIPSSVRAIKHGAVDFLTKPFSDDDLMRAVQTGLAQDRQARLERAEMAALRERYSALTPRERDVLPLVVSGLLNKARASGDSAARDSCDGPRDRASRSSEARHDRVAAQSGPPTPRACAPMSFRARGTTHRASSVCCRTFAYLLVPLFSPELSDDFTDFAQSSSPRRDGTGSVPPIRECQVKEP